MKSIIHKIKKIVRETSIVPTLIVLLLASGSVTSCSACRNDKETTLARITLTVNSDTKLAKRKEPTKPEGTVTFEACLEFEASFSELDDIILHVDSATVKEKNGPNSDLLDGGQVMFFLLTLQMARV